MRKLDLELLAELLAHNQPGAALSSTDQDYLLTLGILAYLEAHPSARAAALLAQTSLQATQADFGMSAWNALTRSAPQDPDFSVEIFRLAIGYDFLPARQWLAANPIEPPNETIALLHTLWQAILADTAFPVQTASSALTHPAYLDISDHLIQIALETRHHVDWASAEEQLRRPDQDFTELVFRVFSHLGENERVFVILRLKDIAETNRSAREALFLTFLEYGNEQSAQIIQNNGWISASRNTQYAFAYLTEQDEQLTNLDPQGNLLPEIFSQASKPLQRRLLAFSRSRGKVAWIRDLPERINRSVQDLSEEDWSGITRDLLTQQRFADLWHLAQNASALWAARILQKLHGTGWLPDTNPEREVFRELLQLAQTCRDDQLSVPQVARLQDPGEALTALSFSPDGETLIATGRGTTIFSWDLASEDLLQPTLTSPVSGNRAIAVSLDQKYLAVGGNDQRIRLFSYPQGRLWKTLDGHRGLIRAIRFHPDGKSLLSAGFDGRLHQWRFPTGELIQALQSEIGELFTFSIFPELDLVCLSGSDDQIEIWQISSNRLLRKLKTNVDGLLHLAGSSTSGLLFSTGRDGSLTAWNCLSGLPLQHFITTGATIAGLFAEDETELALSLNQDGNLQIWNWLSQLPLYTRGLGSPQTLCTANPQLSILATYHSGGPQVWDVSLLLSLTRLHPAGSPRPISLVQSRLKSKRISASGLNWLNFAEMLWNWVQRFEIGLAEPALIQIGEFDIEL